MTGAGDLSGIRIFLVEDESLVALMIEAMIEELGGVVVGAVKRAAEAVEFVAQRHGDIDVALLDLNLGGVRSYDVAQAAHQHGIPVVFSTGYDDASIEPAWRDRPLLGKPFQLAELESALANALTVRAPR